MKRLPKIKKCPRGHRGIIYQDQGARMDWYAVVCASDRCPWENFKTYRTEREAIVEWNRRK